MKVDVDVQSAYSGTETVPDLPLFEQWAQLALREVNEDCELTIRLVDEDESAELNATYRGKNKPTNVLSFPFDSPIPMSPMLVGDLVICVPVVAQEAIAQHKLLNNHWAHLVIHGCLHLLGYDHIESDDAEQMEALEIKLLNSINIANPYLEQGEEK